MVVQSATPRAGWRAVSIGDIADVVGGGTPSTKKPENFNGEIPWLTPKDLSGTHDRYIERGERNVSQQGLDSSSAKLLPPGAVLLSTRAPIGYVALAKNPLSTNQGFRSLVVRDTAVPEYLYYWLKLNTEELERHASGSTFRELSGSSLKEIRLSLPPLAEQRAIARVLGALDNKIELNERMKATLDEMARALFKSWFVDFDPVRAKAEGRQPAGMDAGADLFPDSFEDSSLGPIPGEWGTATLEDVATVTPGRSYKSGELDDSNIALVTLKSVRRGGGYQERGLKPYTGPFRESQVLSVGDIVVATTDLTQGAEVIGRAARVPTEPEFDKLVASLDLAIVRPTEPSFDRLYLFEALRDGRFVDHALAFTNGTTVLHLGRDALRTYELVVPPEDVMARFVAAVAPIHELVDSNVSEARTLTELRDTLLPKLISGEVRVRDRKP